MNIIPEIIYQFTLFCDTKTKFECSLVSKKWKRNVQWNRFDRSYIMMKKYVRNWILVKRKTNYIKNKKSRSLIILTEPDFGYFERKSLKHLVAVSYIEDMPLLPEFEYGLEYGLKRYPIKRMYDIISSFTIFGKNITKVRLHVAHTTVSSNFFLKKEGFCYKTFVPFEFGIPIISMRFCDIHLVFNDDAEVKSIFYKTFCLTRKDRNILQNDQMIEYPCIKYNDFALRSVFCTTGGLSGFRYNTKCMKTRDICEMFFKTYNEDKELEKFIDKNWKNQTRAFILT